MNLALPQGKFGVLICYEAIFPDLTRQFVDRGAQIPGEHHQRRLVRAHGSPLPAYLHGPTAGHRESRPHCQGGQHGNFGVHRSQPGAILQSSEIFTKAILSDTIYLKRTVELLHPVRGSLHVCLPGLQRLVSDFYPVIEGKTRVERNREQDTSPGRESSDPPRSSLT